MSNTTKKILTKMQQEPTNVKFTDLLKIGYQLNAGQTFQVFTGAAPALPPSMAVVKPGRSTSTYLSRFKWEA